MLCRSILSLLAAAVCASAQSNLATLAGTVTDSSGAAAPTAIVRVTNDATGEVYTGTANERGVYVVPRIKPGEYTVVAELQGFKVYRHPGVVLESAARMGMDINLELGAASESVLVTDAAPILQSESSAVSAAVTNQTIANMPLIDRRAAQLVKLSGFVSSGLPTGGSANNSGFAIAGGRADSNQWFIDGGTVQNSTLDTPGLFFDPPIESLQEFRVAVSNFAAELGRSGGGVIQMTTKSGTNSFHGSAYEYFRNDAMDARTFFAAVKPVLRYNLFGGSVGGPIIKNKTFFFFNYEGIRSKTQTTQIVNVPSPAEVAGDFSASTVVIRDPVTQSPFSGNRIPADRLDPVGAKTAALYPVPNVPGRPSGNANYRANQTVDSPHNIYIARVDHIFTDKDRIYGRFMGRTNPQVAGPIFTIPGVDSFNQIVKTTNYDVAATWSHSFTSAFINEARYNWNRRVARAWHGGLDQGLPTKLGITGTNPSYFPRINVTGLEPMGNPNRQGRSQNPVLSNYFADNMTKIAGNHTFKWGGDYRFSSNTDYFFGTAGGSFTFTDVATGSGLASLLTGWVNAASIQEDLPIHSRADTMSLFLQDDWKVSRKLTLNLGLRWDYDVPRREVIDNRQSSFDRAIVNPVSGTPGVITFSGRNGTSEYANVKDLNNFGPRVGFAWQPREGWVIRGGGGLLVLGQYTNNVTFDPALGFAKLASFTSPDTRSAVFQFRNGFPAVNFPTDTELTPGFGAVAVGQPASTAVSFLEQGRRNGYLESFNFNVQRRLSANWVLEAGYLSNLGHKLPGASIQNINQVRPELMAAGNAEQIRRPFPQFNNVSVLAPAIGNSNYHGLNVRVEKRYSSGFNLQANYTFSRFIDDISSRVELGGPGGSGFYNFYSRRDDRGLSGNNISHRFVVSTVYQLPVGKGKSYDPANAVIRTIASGWSLGYIGELRSGAPYGVVEATNRSNSFSDINRPNVVGDPTIDGGRPRSAQVAQWFNTAAFAAPADFTFGNAGKTVGFGPGAIAMDLSLIRDFHVTERHQIEFRLESLNFINNPSFANPNVTRGNAAFGRITGLAPGNQARINQLGLRYSF